MHTKLANNSSICGLDEVGRGALAGPFVAAAVVLTAAQTTKWHKQSFPVRDSKKLSVRQRENVFRQLMHTNVRHQIIIYPAARINQSGIGKCNMDAFRILIQQIPADAYVIDGTLYPDLQNNLLQSKITTHINADETILPVMLASILAKVTRDRLLQNCHKYHPEYGWSTNVGYGTSKHIDALSQFGTTAYHRRQFTDTALSHRRGPR